MIQSISPVVITGGTFDLLHYGHVLHLKTCAALAGGMNKVLVMLVSDEWGEQRKRKPILSYQERTEMLFALGIKSVVPVNEPSDLVRLVAEINPVFYVYEYGTNKKAHDAAIDYCNVTGIGLVNLNKVPRNPFGTSTASIIEKIQNDKRLNSK